MIEQVEDIRRIRLEPGDKLWVKLRDDVAVSPETADAMADHLCERFGLSRDQMVLTVGVDEFAAVDGS